MAIPMLVWAIGALVASYAITMMLTPTTEPQKPHSIEDFDFPQVDEGTPQAVVFGDVVCDGWQVLWYGNFRTSPVKSESASKK